MVPDKLPAAARDSDGNLEGFDIEVAEALSERMGLPVQFTTPGWSNILAGKPEGEWDFAVASMTPTKQRAANLNFPALYRMDAAVVVVSAENATLKEPRDASGKTVAVKSKTTFQRYLEKSLTLDEGGLTTTYIIEGAKIKPVPSNRDALQEVVDGKVDAAITSLATAESAKKAGMAIKVLPGFLYLEPVAVATAKGDPVFDQKIADAVESLREDGTLSKLSIKWFGIDLGTVVP
ncbi:MAG: transporter substrate-binding domain-containing protein [Rhodospirillales bacterium]|nr:transporter substrate-binding domain-containing protein [Rhodospirillales bacterium]